MAKANRRRKEPDLGPIARYERGLALADQQSALEVVTPEQRAKGTYEGGGRRIRNSAIVEKWFKEGHIGFHEGARLAIEWCHKRWEARGVIGKLCASYEPTIGHGGGNPARDIELRDELDTIKAEFHPAHWDIFENVVRWGSPAGVAGSDLADNPPQAIASARAVVGMIASFIATKRGY